MNRGPQSGRAAADHLTKATLAWDGNPPDWIVVLAEEANRTSQAAVAKKLHYSGATISQVLSNSYRGVMARIEEMVRGALMAETVACPALGDLTRNVCLDWQAKPFAATSSLRVQMHRACRDGCPHSRITNRNEIENAD